MNNILNKFLITFVLFTAALGDYHIHESIFSAFLVCLSLIFVMYLGWEEHKNYVRSEWPMVKKMGLIALFNTLYPKPPKDKDN